MGYDHDHGRGGAGTWNIYIYMDYRPKPGPWTPFWGSQIRFRYTMCLRGVFWEPARTERTYPTPRGYVHVEEMEAKITYPGGHCVYFCMHVTGHYAGTPPSDSETFSDKSDAESF